MQIATVIIPNLNGMKYLKGCLDSLMVQSRQDFSVIMIDNGSADGSAEYVESHYPEVILRCFEENRGFCQAVNEGIRMAQTPYVILLNNDTVCEPAFVEKLVEAMEQHPECFSGGAKMVQMACPDRIDSAGDYYCALGWAFAYGKNKASATCEKEREIFSACGGAAIYRMEILQKIGLLDEAHFAYLEDVDLGYRARIAGYRSRYVPGAVVQHVGSATTGSAYNAFKVSSSSRNSVYLIYKNMPWLQILLNAPFLLAGFLLKQLFFLKKGYGREYAVGLWKGALLCTRSKKVKFQRKNLGSYVRIQAELWINILRRLGLF